MDPLSKDMQFTILDLREDIEALYIGRNDLKCPLFGGSLYIYT